jgi:hypothetical protein
MHGIVRSMLGIKIKRFFRRYFTLFFILIVLVFCFLLAEGLLRLFVQPYYGTPPGMFLADDEIDFIPAPGFHGYFLNPEHVDNTIEISINSDGLRDVEHDVDFNGFRVVTLGDSFTMAEQVHLNETYGKVLERALLNDGVDAEVINLGVSGYGTKQSFSFFKMKGETYAPDVVVYAFTTNDLTDNLQQKYVVVAGERLSASYAQDDLWFVRLKVFAYRHSALLRTLYRSLPSPTILDEEDYYVRNGGDPAWEALRSTLFTMKTYYDERDIVFVVMYNTPHQRLVSGLDGADFDRVLLRELTWDLGIPFVDPTDALFEEDASQFYFAQDKHWNVLGHEFIGNYLYITFINERLVSPSYVTQQRYPS